MNEIDLKSALMDWASNLLRLALHDFNRCARDAGLSLAQMNVLVHLYYRGPSEVNNVCAMMQLSPAGASQMIERLVQQGMVQRAGVPGDRRVRMVSLTGRGREAVAASLAAQHAWIDALADSLPVEERAAAAQALRALNERARSLKVEP